MTAPGTINTDLSEEFLAARRLAVEELYMDWRPRVAAVARRALCSRPDYVDDVVQDTFVRALEALDPTMPRPRCLQWLKRTARNLAIDRLRRESLRVFVPVDEASAVPPRGPQDPGLGIETRDEADYFTRNPEQADFARRNPEDYAVGRRLIRRVKTGAAA